jgi:hypothetical protein
MLEIQGCTSTYVDVGSREPQKWLRTAAGSIPHPIAHKAAWGQLTAHGCNAWTGLRGARRFEDSSQGQMLDRKGRGQGGRLMAGRGRPRGARRPVCSKPLREEMTDNRGVMNG